MASFLSRPLLRAGRLGVVPARTHTGYMPFEGRPGFVDKEEFRFDQGRDSGTEEGTDRRNN